MTKRERIWRNIKESAQQYEAPSHLSDDQLLAIAKRLEPMGPHYLNDAEAFGKTRKQMYDEQDGKDL